MGGGNRHKHLRDEPKIKSIMTGEILDWIGLDSLIEGLYFK